MSSLITRFCRNISASFSTVAIAVGISTGSASATTFNIRSFGALGDGQHNDQPAIQAAVNAAITAGVGNVVLLPQGKYMLDPSPGYQQQIQVSLANKLEIRGEACTTLLNPIPTRSFFYIWGSNHLIVDHVDLQRTNRLFSQMKVMSINKKDNSLTVNVSKGYDDLDSKYLTNANQLLVFNDPSSGSWGDHSAACEYYAPGDPSVCWPPVVNTRTRIAENVWKLTLNTVPLDNYLGATAVLWDWNSADHSMAIIVQADTDTTIRDMKYFPAGSDGLFTGVDNSGTMLFSNVSVSTLPTSNDFISGYSGSWSANNHWKLDIEDSSFTKIWDDALNTGSLYARVVHKINNQTIDVEDRASDLRVGDKVAIWDWTTGMEHEQAQAQITAVDCGSEAGEGNCRVFLDRPVNITKAGAAIDGGSNTDGINRFIDISDAGSLVVNRCEFQDHHDTGVASKASPTIVTNTNFHDIIGPAINIGAGLSWGEGPSSSAVTIKNNTFSNVSSTNVIVGTARVGDPYAPELIDATDAEISNNKFYGYGRYSIGTTGFAQYPIAIQYVKQGAESQSGLVPFNALKQGFHSTYVLYSPGFKVK